MKRAIIAVVLLAVVGGGVGAWYSQATAPRSRSRPSPVNRGDIVDTVGATGTLQAVTTVQVGSQVSGNIQWLGADFNSIVKKGQEIARLDPSLFDAQLQQVQANLVQARANLTKARSELDRARVQLTDAQQKYARAKELASQELLAASELDAAKIAVDSAQASVASQQATVAQVQAAVTQSEASVNQSQVNRDHTVILAPIDGIVTQRSVDVGQTVAASMQAPTLFVIAADLTEMQVNANIDEADVGRIRPGQQVSFKCRRLPNRQLRRNRDADSTAACRGAERHHIRHRDHGPEPRAQTEARHDRQREDRNRQAHERAACPERGARFRPTEEILRRAATSPAARSDWRARVAGVAAAWAAAPRATRHRRLRRRRTAMSSRLRVRRPPPLVLNRPPPLANHRASHGETRRHRAAAAGGGGERRRRIPGRRRARRSGIPGTHARTLQDHVSRRAAAIPCANARARRRYDRHSKRRWLRRAADARRKRRKPHRRRPSMRFSLPCRPVESRGRAWLYVDKQLKPVALRLGISDGTYTELLSGELQEQMELATGVTGLQAARADPRGDVWQSADARWPRSGGRGGPPGGGRGF